MSHPSTFIDQPLDAVVNNLRLPDSTETLHARIASLEAALAVSYAREDQSYSSAYPPGPKIHPLLKPEFVDYEGSKESDK